MKITTVQIPNTPKIGPFSVAKIFNGVLYISGQLGLHPITSALISDNVEDQTHQIMKSIGAILQQSNSSYQNILKCTVYLTDMKDFPKVNNIYGSYFKQDPPARVCIAVKELPKQAKVEIDAIAVVLSKSKL